jgi:hypothetical protein
MKQFEPGDIIGSELNPFNLWVYMGTGEATTSRGSTGVAHKLLPVDGIKEFAVLIADDYMLHKIVGERVNEARRLVSPSTEKILQERGIKFSDINERGNPKTEEDELIKRILGE